METCYFECQTEHKHICGDDDDDNVENRDNREPDARACDLSAAKVKERK